MEEVIEGKREMREIRRRFIDLSRKKAQSETGALMRKKTETTQNNR